MELCERVSVPVCSGHYNKFNKAGRRVTNRRVGERRGNGKTAVVLMGRFIYFSKNAADEVLILSL